jgi:quinol monooxygenase YgiN
MLTLISVWKLRDGCPAELAQALQDVAAKVREAEPRTLGYSVHLAAAAPLGPDRQVLVPPPPPVPGPDQSEVVFFEIYADARAFEEHVNGPVFTAFRQANLRFFHEDPANAGWPLTVNTYLDRQSGFFRHGASE